MQLGSVRLRLRPSLRLGNVRLRLRPSLRLGDRLLPGVRLGNVPLLMRGITLRLLLRVRQIAVPVASRWGLWDTTHGLGLTQLDDHLDAAIRGRASYTIRD